MRGYDIRQRTVHRRPAKKGLSRYRTRQQQTSIQQEKYQYTKLGVVTGHINILPQSNHDPTKFILIFISN